MLVAIHQPHYLPWLRYFEKIARADAFIVLDNIQFSKNGWQNRNRIKTPNGPALLTVPVLARHRQRLDAVRIDNTSDWARKHGEALRQAYGRTPHFAACAEVLTETYAQTWEYLNDLNRHMLHAWLRLLEIDTPIHYASRFDVSGTATTRLVNLVRAVDGDAYYSGAYALEAYLDASMLAEAGIGLKLQRWNPPVYAQGRGAFLPDLSIVDMWAHCGPQSRALILDAGATPLD